MRKTTNGFTIIELAVVITIIAILSTLGAVSFSSVQARTRDTQRSSKITQIAEALEKYYGQNGEYPSCDTMSKSAATVVTSTLVNLDPVALATPTATSGTNSILTNCVNMPTGYTSDRFAYVGNASCTASPYTATCPSWTLKYREEATGNIILLSSRHKAYNLAINAGTNGNVNTAVNGIYGGGSIITITATPNSGYKLSSWGGSNGCSGVASHAITMDSDKACTANFAVDPWTNWYPGIAATAMAGKYIYKADLGVAYQYKTTDTAVTSLQGATGLDPNYPSYMSLVNPQTNPGVDFSAYPAQNACKALGGRLPNTYELQAIIPDGATYGNNFMGLNYYYWSTTEVDDTDAYNVKIFYGAFVDIDTKTGTAQVRCVADGNDFSLAITAGSNGTVNSAANGNYGTNSTITIIATPNSGYAFTNWTGSAGCNGITTASYAITMDSNKTCTANFTLPSVIGNQTLAYTGAIVNFTVPASVTSITIAATGAQGGQYSASYPGGKGASAIGTFAVTPGQVLSILVGQQPTPNTSAMPGGGGGTFVALGSSYTTATPMIVAGGGGGSYSGGAGQAGQITNITTTGNGGGPVPGTNGNGAASTACGGGGGGFYTSGGNDINYPTYGKGGAGFRLGGAGGVGLSYQAGGFGGGATADYVGSCNTTAGSGGGYSGGSGQNSGASVPSGWGGGSYNSGTAQTNTAAANSGNGQVYISWGS